MTEEQHAGTSGGAAGTSGWSARTLTVLLLAAMLLFGIVRITANVYSFLQDRAGLGTAIPATTAWLYEGTGLAAWMVMLVPCWFAVRTIRPPRFRWPIAITIHALLAVPVALAHVAVMVGLRTVAWWLAGDSYQFGNPGGDPILYEFRKNIATYAELIFILFLVQWLVARYAAPPVPKDAPTTLAVTDGSVVHHLPIAEIDHVAAAGNYVEIAWHGRRLLHRATLGAIEAELTGAGFARIHRSRLVRKAAVRRVVTHKSGDFDVETERGDTLRGSRRFRANVEG